MEDGPGFTLYEPSDTLNSLQEEDEDEIEEKKQREKVLQEQLDKAFNDWTEEDYGDHGHSSCGSSSQGDASREGGSPNQSSLQTNGMILHNLRDIIEHSPNNSEYHAVQVSKDSDSGNSTVPNGNIFPPSMSLPKKLMQGNNGSTKFMEEIGGRGDADQYQPIFFKNRSNIENNEKYKPIFPVSTISEKSENSNCDSAESYRQAEYNSVEQLEVLYQVRLCEIQRLTGELEAERNNTAKYKEETFRKVALLEAEKERAVLSRTEATKLLVASKEEIAKFQEEVQSLKNTVVTLEKDKTKSDELMELSRVQVQELEQRIALMERCDSHKTFVKQTDIMIKELKNKHQQEVHLLQRQMDTLNKKLLKKEEECVALGQKMTELQRGHELLLAEKVDTINQLARSLQNSQAQCQQLMASSVSVDNVRLQNQLEDALQGKEQLSKTVTNLQAECNMLRADLTQLESSGLSRLTLPQSHSSSDETDSIVQLGLDGRQSYRRNANQSNITSTLKGELHRALLNQRAKRTEIDRLKEVVNTKEQQIQEMMKQERIYLAQTETLNEKLNKMMAELASFREENEKTDGFGDKAEEMSTLHAEIAELRKDKAVLEREKLETQSKLDEITKCFEAEKQKVVSDHSKEYLKFHDETVAKVRKEVEEEAELKVKEYRIRLEHSLKEVNELKEMYIALCTAKEQLANSLSETTERLQQLTEERDKLAAEMKKDNAVRDHLARQLNETEAVDQTTHKLQEERDRLKTDLDKCVEMRDQLARRVNSMKKENDELTSEIERLKAEIANGSSHKSADQLDVECTLLREELSAMSARHTQELSTVRAELQGARDRVVQLEKNARLQFETEMKSLRQDRDMLRVKCDEKEVQIKKLIDSRKRPPPMVSVATETDMCGEMLEVQRLEERHRRELARCREEYNHLLVLMEQAQQEALVSARNKIQGEINQQMIEAHREELKQQELSLKTAYRDQLLAVQERTKQLTVQYFAEEIKKLEAKYREDLSHKTDPAVLESLQNKLLGKTREVESLRQMLASVNEEWQQKVAALQSQAEADRDNASHLMVQWVQEVKNIQGDLKLKEAIIDDQRLKLEKARALAKKNHDKLVKTNQTITAQYTSKCAEYKGRMLKRIEDGEKLVFEKIMQLDEIYKKREIELKKMLKLSKKQHIT